MVRLVIGGALALLALLAAFVLEGGNPGALVGLSAALITVLGPWFAVLAVWTWQDWRSSWGHAFRAAPSREAAAVSAAIWRTSEFLCYAFAILGTLLGAVLVLGNLAGADLGQVGRALAAMAICPVYAVSFAVGCRLMRARVEHLAP